MSTVLVRARIVFVSPERWLEGGGLLLRGGRVERVLGSPGAVRRAQRLAARTVDLGSDVVTPGLVNAHAHLELSGLRGLLPRGRGLAPWIRELLRLRASRSPRRLVADARGGARRCLETGTTTVGDVDSTGAGARAYGGGGPRVVLFREVLDAWDPGRTSRTLAGIRRALPARARRWEGISPHAPYTTSRKLLAGVRALAERRRVPLATHWSESEEEIAWMERGEGPLAGALGDSPRRRGLDLLEEAGLLGRRIALVHGNHPARGEPGRIAAAGSILVHCPGTHAFFAREPFPWRRYLRAGVGIALGTDSLASNEDLDLRAEMARVRCAAPWLAPGRVLAMATTEAARALGLDGRVGALARGAQADLVAHRLEEGRPSDLLEELTGGGAAVTAVWIGGRPALFGNPVPLP